MDSEKHHVRCIVELARIYGIRSGSAGKVSLEGDNILPKTQKDLAGVIGISEKQLKDYKKLLTLIPELQNLVEDDVLSPTIVY